MAKRKQSGRSVAKGRRTRARVASCAREYSAKNSRHCSPMPKKDRYACLRRLREHCKHRARRERR